MTHLVEQVAHVLKVSVPTVGPWFESAPTTLLVCHVLSLSPPPCCLLFAMSYPIKTKSLQSRVYKFCFSVIIFCQVLFCWVCCDLVCVVEKLISNEQQKQIHIHIHKYKYIYYRALHKCLACLSHLKTVIKVYFKFISYKCFYFILFKDFWKFSRQKV